MTTDHHRGTVRAGAERSPSRARARATAPWGRVLQAEREMLRAGFGAELAAARRTAGLSRPALARRVGCSAGLVRHLERGTCRPREAAIRLLAYALEPDDPRPLRKHCCRPRGIRCGPTPWAQRGPGPGVASMRSSQGIGRFPARSLGPSPCTRPPPTPAARRWPFSTGREQCTARGCWTGHPHCWIDPAWPRRPPARR